MYTNGLLVRWSWVRNPPGSLAISEDPQCFSSLCGLFLSLAGKHQIPSRIPRLGSKSGSIAGPLVPPFHPRRAGHWHRMAHIERVMRATPDYPPRLKSFVYLITN